MKGLWAAGTRLSQEKATVLVDVLTEGVAWMFETKIWRRDQGRLNDVRALHKVQASSYRKQEVQLLIYLINWVTIEKSLDARSSIKADH